jgi:hypothetical protein
MNGIPMDIWINLFESSGVKEKIRILSLSKSIRDHIYEHYGGEEKVNSILEREKILQEVKQKAEISVSMIRNLIKEYKEDNDGDLVDAEYLATWYYDIISSEISDLLTDYVNTYEEDDEDYDNDMYEKMMNKYCDQSTIEKKVLSTLKANKIRTA